MKSTLRLAIAQLNPTIGDLSGNAQAILEAAQQAASQGADLVLTPELSLCGYPPRDLLFRPSFITAMAETLTQLAQQLPPQVGVLIGFATTNPDARDHGEKPLFNSTALVWSGRVHQVFHKQLLPTYDVFDEDRYFSPGRGASYFDWPLDNPSPPGEATVRVGVTICEDLWNDEEFWGGRTYPRNPIADLAQQGVDLVVNLSASPYSVGKQQLRESMLGHSAARFRCPIVYANQIGANDDLIFDGSSVAFNRQGNVMVRALGFQPDLTLVEFERQQRDFMPGPVAPLPLHHTAEIWAALVLGVRDYAHKCGFSRAVIGLSGGIDSSLVATIATAALGAANVLGVLMPSPYSSETSLQDAYALADNLGIHTTTLPIGNLMAGYGQTLAELFAGTEFGVAEENIQSRIRGNLLMAVANKFGYLLLSTGNKSEMAVGYCTLYGDMNGGLAVIADVPKTQVYSLCRWLNQRATENSAATSSATLPFAKAPIPTNVLAKPPSAELKPDQQDQDSLPAYDILDDILERLVQHHESLQEIVAAGHDPATVEQVTRLLARAEFKRRQAPPVLKITDRAFGMGWRMPIANRWSPSLPRPQDISAATAQPLPLSD
ncbi:putative glutamine-dependent NAD(+) synthetase [Halomicronema hongdechloris C2206]|uniref:Glutamine-dependent NAD(+) synthetase n=1 Tax=Halomicronema hongdechloris C2206 TaxID=1641165 RepID=A0A1Z3HQZ4_9CYAN|nr:NAD+ synthase [Halomicronema hongdechloris]ASC72672.1 putative glutamine-dependent NAD(+) synthetase [Halomicronema hongdechloris C2206]